MTSSAWNEVMKYVKLMIQTKKQPSNHGHWLKWDGCFVSLCWQRLAPWTHAAKDLWMAIWWRFHPVTHLLTILIITFIYTLTCYTAPIASVLCDIRFCPKICTSRKICTSLMTMFQVFTRVISPDYVLRGIQPAECDLLAVDAFTSYES